MNRKEIFDLAEANRLRALEVLANSGIEDVWRKAGCRVEIVGSLRMGLLASHRDIDLHVYSSGITEESSFAIAAKMASLKGVGEITCINGLHTDEHCVAWHVQYKVSEDETWKFDIIHIEAGSYYDGFFERMARRIVHVITPEQRELILKLKFETPADEIIHGVEYYEAVIADGVSTLDELRLWLPEHRRKPQYYWIP